MNLKTCTIFFKYEKQGGLYLWVFKGNPQRIRYIGEADVFKNRFSNGYKSYMQNITHGLYTAVNCSTQKDLVDKYKEIVEKGKTAKYAFTQRN